MALAHCYTMHRLLLSIFFFLSYFITCRSSNELSFRVTIPQHNKKEIWIYSNANDIVTVIFNANRKMVDCDVAKKNRDAVKDLFYHALAGKVGDERVVQEMDVTKLGRQCKKFLRDMKRKKVDDRSGVVKDFRKFREMKEGVSGTRWCKTLAPSDVSHNDYGSEKNVDKCCQRLHSCNQTIDALRANHQLFNYHTFKLPSCECVQAFKDCLQKIKGHVAKHVRHLYFDVVGLTCYKMKDVNTCVQWNKWYKTCRKQRVTQEAKRIVL